MSRPVVAASKRTRRRLATYASAYEAARKYGMSTNAVRYQCDERSLGDQGVYFRWEEDFDPQERFEGTRGLPIEVEFHDGGVELYTGARDAAEANGVSYSSIVQAARTGKAHCGLLVRAVREPR